MINPVSSLPPGARNYALLITLSLIWGASFALIKIAVATIPPVTLAAARIALAAAVFVVLQSILRQPFSADLRRWGQFLMVGILGNGLPFVLIGYGEIRIDSGIAAILIGVMPVFTVIFATLTGVERGLTGRRALGLGCGFAGLVVLVGPASLMRLEGDGLAYLALIAAASSYAATGVYARHLFRTIPMLTLATGSMIASTLLMVPMAVWLDQPWSLDPTMAAVAATFSLGVLSTGLAALIYFRLLISAGPIFASTINYLIPAIGVLLGVVWLGERLALGELAAFAMIVAGIALARPQPVPQSS
ncbi:MAG: DMT family transporter [Alphaproteobacteria bacterium]